MGKSKKLGILVSKDISEFDYEASIARLNEITALLESAETPLAASLTLFEEGQGILRACQAWLDQAELRLEQASTAQ